MNQFIKLASTAALISTQVHALPVEDDNQGRANTKPASNPKPAYTAPPQRNIYNQIDDRNDDYVYRPIVPQKWILNTGSSSAPK